MPLDYTAIQSQLHILSGQIVEKHNLEHEQVGPGSHLAG